MLIYWAWEKAKIMASIKTTNQLGQPVYQVSNFYTKTLSVVFKLSTYEFYQTTKIQSFVPLNKIFDK